MTKIIKPMNREGRKAAIVYEKLSEREEVEEKIAERRRRHEERLKATSLDRPESWCQFERRGRRLDGALEPANASAGF